MILRFAGLKRCRSSGDNGRARLLGMLDTIIFMNCPSSGNIKDFAGIYLLWLCLFTAVAHAQQFSITSWGHKDGLPSTTVYTITQTTDGFLWIGTGDGLIRFDGFQFIQPELTGKQPLGQVTALESLKGNGLLIGTAGGLVAEVEGRVTASTLLGSAVERIKELGDHTVEVETHSNVIRLQQKDLSTISSLPRSQPPSNAVESLGYGEVTSAKELAPVQPLIRNLQVVRKILRDTNGATWIATESQGLFRIAPGGAVQSFGQSAGLPSNHIRDIFQDQEGNLWVGTQNGLARLRRDKFITYTQRDGLLSDIATSLVPARDGGGIWIGSPSGLELFDGASGRQDLLIKGTAVNSVLQFKGGSLLISTDNGIEQMNGHATPRVLPKPYQHVEQITESEGGDLWLYGQQDGLWHWKANANPEPVNEPALQGAIVTSMQGGQHDQVWLGLANGDIIQRLPAGSHVFTPVDGLTGGSISFLSPQADGTLWAASDRGLAFFDGERFRSWGRSSGLPGDRLLWVIPDRQGKLWLGYGTGVARLSISELLGTSTSVQQLQYDFYDDGDGLKSNPEVHGSSPVARTADGRLWVSMSEGIGMIDPAHVHLNTLPPPVHILELRADGRGMALSSGMKVPPHTRNLQVSYTGISLSEPRKVRFRYRLDGFDTDWQDAGTRRNAFYTNLRPGHYRFQVMAANNDGVWNQTGDSLSLEIQPAFYQTPWFLLLCVLSTLTLFFMAYRLRIRLAARELQSRYEERMSERTRIAQDLHDNLIQEMMGISLQLEIADELTVPGATAKGPLQRALDLSQAALANGRSALQVLRERPFSREDIESTLRDTVQSVTGSQEVVRFTSAGKAWPIQAAPGVELLQIIREALRNALQHAGPGGVAVRSEYGDRFLKLSVSDHGPGIKQDLLQNGKPAHFGIRGMRERATRMGFLLAVSSSATTGTEWTLTVPASTARNPDDIPPGQVFFKRYMQTFRRILSRKEGSEAVNSNSNRLRG